MLSISTQNSEKLAWLRGNNGAVVSGQRSCLNYSSMGFNTNIFCSKETLRDERSRREELEVLLEEQHQRRDVSHQWKC